MQQSTGLPSTEEEKLYWKNNFVFKYMRFFNLLEPGRNVLSLSKILVWANIATLVYVMIQHPDQIVAVIGASASAAATMLNYAYRRHVNHKRDIAAISMAMPSLPDDPRGPVDES